MPAWNLKNFEDTLLNKPQSGWMEFFDSATEGKIPRSWAFRNIWMFEVLAEIFSRLPGAAPVPEEAEKAVITDLCERLTKAEGMIRSLRAQLGRKAKTSGLTNGLRMNRSGDAEGAVTPNEEPHGEAGSEEEEKT